MLSWAAAVVAATMVGLVAVGAIGDGIIGSGPRPLTQAEVDTQLAAAAAPVPPAGPAAAADPPAAPNPTPAPPTPAADAPVALPSPGGTVLARCVNGTPRVMSVTPAQGFRVHDDDDETRPGRVEFESADDTSVELRLSCTDGRPSADVRVETDD